MNEQQKRLVEMLNDMYHSQGDEYKSHYRDNYFELLQHIISPRAYISGEKIIDGLNKKQEEEDSEEHEWKELTQIKYKEL